MKTYGAWEVLVVVELEEKRGRPWRSCGTLGTWFVLRIIELGIDRSHK